MAIPIEDLPIEEAMREKIKSLNVHTIEELLSLLTAMRENPQALMKVFGLDEEQLDAFTETVKQQLPPELAEELSKRPDLERMPLGALIEDESSQTDRQEGPEKDETHSGKGKK